MGNRAQAYLVASPPSRPAATLRGSYLQMDPCDRERGAGRPHPGPLRGLGSWAVYTVGARAGKGASRRGTPGNSGRSVCRGCMCVHTGAVGASHTLAPAWEPLSRRLGACAHLPSTPGLRCHA